MALIHALIAALARSAGKVLNTVFGWATALLFGRVSQKKQIAMSIVTFGSILWIIAIIGMIFPSVGAFAITAFIPHHERYDEAIRIAMLASALIIPFIVGAVKMAVHGHRMNGKHNESKFRQLLDGWPYTIGLAITLLLMMVFAPIMKAKMMIKRWRAEHIPVMIETEHYADGVNDLEAMLEHAGYRVVRKPADWMLRFPTQVLTWFASKQVKDLVADELTVLEGNGFSLELHPSDLIVSGREKEASRVRALIAEKLLFCNILMTWDAEANKLEKQMKKIWQKAHENNAAFDALLKDAERIKRQIDSITVRYEEWEVIYRQYLHLEQYLLRAKLQGYAEEPKKAA